MPERDQRIDFITERIDFITVLEFRKQEAKRNGKGEVVIDENSGEIGEASYYHSGIPIDGRLYLINTRTDKGYINYIYDDLGHSIATYWINNDGTKEYRKDNDVEINEVMLMRQIQLGIERIQNGNELKDVENGSSQGGEGRDKHVEKNKEEQSKEERIKDKKENNLSENKEDELVNLREEYGISINRRTKIELNTLINGARLWDILGIEEKFQNRLPNGLSKNAFRYGFLTVIDSKELESKDGKKRAREKVLAVSTRDGKNIIELDETILRPQPVQNEFIQQEIEKATTYYRNGEEVAGPKNRFQNTETALFEIPNASSRFNVNENWYLSIDTNKDYKMEKTQLSGSENVDEISFVQQTMGNSERTVLEQAKAGRLKTKLEAYNEPHLDNAERNMNLNLGKWERNEAANVKKDHIDELAEKILNGKTENEVQKHRQEKLQEIYNINDIKKQVKELHDKGNSDEEIEAIILNQNYEDVKVRGPKEGRRA